MKPHRLAAVATAAALTLTGISVAGPAEAAAKPGVVVDYDYDKIKIKPKNFRPYKDVHFSNVRWSSLTRSTGYATAVQNVNTCIPDCAAANYEKTKVKLKFNRVRLSDCRKVFSRVKVTEVKSKKSRTLHLPVFKKSC
ncbi:hypothetical protein [Actinoplanes aureus]|uniref:Uncharacterized protein n=1 Tax=Actinoplanes aureus TaxID=2792083 RepID=A0A931G0I6_9ACTN|nr:hypothetical protein [Actinoplanes aureus]MBG0564106.1 hypothetical protein [Actinoplanes aureus]